MLLDTLEVLIQADAKGLESTLKGVLKTATGVIDDINKEEVDWTSIFARSVTPAIIAGVASMLAFAISQSLQFQQATTQIGEAAGVTGTQLQAMQSQSQALASQTGQNSIEIAQAFGAVKPVFTDAAAQQAFLTDATQLAASGFGSLGDIVQSVLPLMQMWGVTTQEQVNTVFTQLMHGAQGSGESLSDFAKQFQQLSPDIIAGGAQIGDLNNLLSGFAASISKLGLEQAQAAFKVFGSAVSGASPALNAMLGSSKSLLSTLRDQGLPQVLADMGDKIKASGQNATLLYTNFGLSTDAINGLESSATRLPDIASDANKIATNTLTIKDAFDQSDTSMRHFQQDWETIKADFSHIGGFLTPIVTGVADLVTGAFDGVVKGLSSTFSGFGSVLTPIVSMVEKITGLKLPDIGSFVSQVTQALGGMQGIGQILGSSAVSTTLNLLTGGFSGAANLVSSLSSAASSLLGSNPQVSGLNSALQKTGVGFDQGTLSRIDQTASQNGLIDSLVSALQTGIKSGQYAQLTNTFHLSVPQGSQGLTANMIAAQLYSQFQGTTK